MTEQLEGLTLVQRLRAIATAYKITGNKATNEYSACTEAADEIERLQRCHRIVAKQVGFYKPELPDFTKIEIYLGILRAAERCAGFAAWEIEESEAALSTAKSGDGP